MTFRFAAPYFLLLLVLPWGWWLLAVIRQKTLGRTGGAALHIAAPKEFQPPPVSLWLILSRLMPWVKLLALSLMIFALARPQAGEERVKMNTEGVNIILALDLSESMQALDFKRDKKIVTRLEAVKGVVGQFILEREGDRLGLVVFGSHAYTQLPLTRDYNTIAFMLEHLKIGAAGPRTAVGDAIGVSLKRLADIESKSNIIILLTDGRSNAGSLSWQDAVALAARKGVKIHTIGVGSKGKAPFLVDGFFGKQYVYQEVDMDWEALQTIAARTGGRFFRAADTEGLQEIYAAINAMEKTAVEVDKWVDFQERFAWFLVPGLGLYLLCLILGHTRLMRSP